MKQFDLSIVIPAYCEERRIGRTLDVLASFLQRDAFFQTKTVEVLIVAADALDRTQDIVQSKLSMFSDATLLQPGRRVGKGRDVQYGMLRAHGQIVMYMDADLATPLHHLREFYVACSKGVDVVIGTRDLLKYRKSFARNLFSRFGNLLYVVAGGVRVEDTQCGFKMFNQRAAQICFSKLTLMGWGFDLEVLAIARANKLKIRSFRIDDWGDKLYSTYTDGALRIIFRTVHDFVIIEINKLRGVYGES